MKKSEVYAEEALTAYGMVAIFAAMSGVWYTSYLESSSGYKVESYLNAIFVACGLLGTILLAFAFILNRQRKKRREAVFGLASNHAEVTVDEFLALGNGYDFTGVYILHNTTEGIYYVGQSVRVMQRVRQHFTGHGNGDVYADYKYGHRFTVKVISLTSSGYSSLDDLERDMIEAHYAYSHGYNKQRGNGRH